MWQSNFDSGMLATFIVDLSDEVLIDTTHVLWTVFVIEHSDLDLHYFVWHLF